MGNNKVVFIILIVLNSLSACVKDKPGVGISNAHQTISAIVNLPNRDQQACMNSDVCPMEEFPFDVEDYFGVLDSLSMEEGYELDYVYIQRRIFGEPIIYAYKEDELPYSSFQEFMEELEFTDDLEAAKFSNGYLNHIHVKDSPQGYFQFAALSLLGDLFYRYWHSCADQISIITTEDEAIKTFSEVASRLSISRELNSLWGWGMTLSIRRLDFTPRVELTEDVAKVFFITYSEWEGFSEIRTTISRDFPHEIISLERNILIDYAPGVQF